MRGKSRIYTNSDTVKRARASERKAELLQERIHHLLLRKVSCARNSPGQPIDLVQILMRKDLEVFRDGSIEVGDEGAGKYELELTDRVSRYEARHSVRVSDTSTECTRVRFHMRRNSSYITNSWLR